MLLDQKILKQLECLQINARRSFLGSRQGGHLSIKRGHGIEFSDYRKYEPGDDPRHIDWSLLARSERLYIKRFQEEQDLTVHIFLDTSASMFHEPLKLRRALEILQALSYVAMSQHDPVQLSLPGNMIGQKFGGSSGFLKICDASKPEKLKSDLDYQKNIYHSVASANFPGRAFYISDFLSPLDEIKQIMSALLGKNLDITAIQVLSVEELAPDFSEISVLGEAESRRELKVNLNTDVLAEYQQLLVEHNTLLKSFLHQRRIDLISVDTSESLAEIFYNKFQKAGSFNA